MTSLLEQAPDWLTRHEYPPKFRFFNSHEKKRSIRAASFARIAPQDCLCIDLTCKSFASGVNAPLVCCFAVIVCEVCVVCSVSISTERHRAEVRRAVNDERLTTIAYQWVSPVLVTCDRSSALVSCSWNKAGMFCSMSGPNSSSEWSIEGRRLVPLMPRLVPQTAFTVMANAMANATAHQNSSLLLPADTANKEGTSDVTLLR